MDVVDVQQRMTEFVIATIATDNRAQIFGQIGTDKYRAREVSAVLSRQFSSVTRHNQ